MKPEVKTLWLEALRSGEYEQGNGRLNKDGKFCCLGVLCEVAIQQGLEVFKNAGSDGLTTYGRIEQLSTLPVEVQKWSGVDGFYGWLPTTVDGDKCLAFLNDRGVPFSRIADIIEEHL